MGFFTWIILGLISGFIASKIFYKSGSGFLLNVAIGVIGAMVGGVIGARLGYGGVTGLNLWSILLSVVGAVIVLWIYNALAARRRY